jgi:hypothetical protein
MKGWKTVVKPTPVSLIQIIDEQYAQKLQEQETNSIQQEQSDIGQEKQSKTESLPSSTSRTPSPFNNPLIGDTLQSDLSDANLAKAIQVLS